MHNKNASMGICRGNIKIYKGKQVVTSVETTQLKTPSKIEFPKVFKDQIKRFCRAGSPNLVSLKKEFEKQT
jgi:hypothetical protein